jgi:hypothetical protein
MPEVVPEADPPLAEICIGENYPYGKEFKTRRDTLSASGGGGIPDEVIHAFTT